MDLIVSWILFPALLLVLFTGCGLVVELAAGRSLPTALLPAAGLAATIVLGTALMAADVTAEAAAPACAVLAVAGLALATTRRRLAPGIWPLAALATVLAVYALPIVASGEATIAGFVKLDDTATWLAFTDRIAEHGRDLDGLAPSTYEATLALNIGAGYPIGSLVPLAVGSSITGVDPAWLVQPYMAALAAILALALWVLAAPLAARPALRFAAAVIGAQSALLFGYYLWGGVKEVLAAALLAALAALLLPALGRGAGPRALLPAVLTAAALVSALSAGAAIWLLSLAAGAMAVLVAREGARFALVRAGSATLPVVVLSLPTLLAGIRPPTSSPLDDSGALGNLAGPLDPLQVAGIWAAGDFRFQPEDELATYTLAALACVAAAGAVVWALRHRERGVALYVLGLLAGCLVLTAAGSPWVDGKALATASAALPFAAMLGAGLLVSAGRFVLGGALALAIAGGVIWSNALAYRDVNLAPRDQLEELEQIGELAATEGPALITEYSPYGARHFLRDADPESISELRRRVIPLRDGSQVPKGKSADTDRISPDALGVYRSLIVRRSPLASRPPSAYRLAWTGRYYELWQRPVDADAALARLGLGTERRPATRPRCAAVRELAASVPASAQLVAAARPEPVVVSLSRAAYPEAWGAGRPPAEPRPVTPGTLAVEVDVVRAGEYELWLATSLRPRVTASVDGTRVGEVRHVLNNRGAYVSLGEAVLEPGAHSVEVEFHAADLAPGSDGYPDPLGPLVLARAGAAVGHLTSAPAARAERFCGRHWDWIEAVAGG